MSFWDLYIMGVIFFSLQNVAEIIENNMQTDISFFVCLFEFVRRFKN